MSDIPVYIMNYIKATDAGEYVGCRWDEFDFIENCENDSYTELYLADWKIEELEEEIEWCKNRFLDKSLQRFKNELKLVNYLRSKGYKDSIYVYVSW